MLAKLSPFFPALLVVVGALFVTAGGFWASWRQSNFNIDIRAKNEEISRLQRENVNAITGDSFMPGSKFLAWTVRPSTYTPCPMTSCLFRSSSTRDNIRFTT
jgi:hypothetical protein